MKVPLLKTLRHRLYHHHHLHHRRHPRWAAFAKSSGLSSFKAFLETGQQLLSCENLPQLDLCKEQVEDLVIRLEAEMFGDLENRYRNTQISFEQSFQVYITEGMEFLNTVRGHDGFVRVVAWYKGIPC